MNIITESDLIIKQKYQTRSLTINPLTSLPPQTKSPTLPKLSQFLKPNSLLLLALFYTLYKNMARLLFRLLQETTTSPSPSQVTSSPALNSDLILILATILCALICLLGLLAVSRCAWLRRSASNSNGNSSDQTPQPSIANKGLKKKVLRSLPKLTYSPDTENFSDCAICLTEFVAGDELRVLPQCNHVFHVSCIDTWLGSHSSCPSCRQILVVARCHKCGGLPGSSGSGSGSGSGSEPDNRVKQDHDNGPNPSDSLP